MTVLKRLGLVALLGLVPQYRAWNFNFGTFGNQEPVLIYGSGFDADAVAYVGLYDIEKGAELNNYIPLDDCVVHKQRTFENSDEMLPLTQTGYYYIECQSDPNRFTHDTVYGLWVSVDGEEQILNEVTVQYDENQSPRSRYEDTNAQSLQEAKSKGRRYRREDNPKPRVEGITPREGSPKGGVIVTIYGQNLQSRKIDLGGQKSEGDEGENYQVWFEREWEGEKWVIPCDVDRMLTLHARPLNGQDFVLCETREMPRFYRFYLKMTIDDGDVLSGGHFDFYESKSPTADYFYPANSGPAFAKGQWDYEGEFFTKWFDVDDNSDGIEDESFWRHWFNDRKEFQNCQNPIGIEVYNKDTLKPYENSANENADGKPQADFIDAVRGFKCQNSTQTINPKTGTQTISCPNTKVRYRCVPGINQMKGRIYTAVHGRSDDPDFHANRLHESPKIVNDNDGYKSEAVIHLNDGQNCGSHPNCGQNKRLNFKKVSGNDGLIHYLAKTSIPGAYNFTYETTHQGKVVVNKRWNNYMTSDDLYPVNYEVYPQIKSVYPQMGSLNGGTLLTIDGTGFISDGLGGTVSVTVGETECMIESMTETQIKCRTVAGTEEEPTWEEAKRAAMVNTDGKSTSEFQRTHFTLDQVPTAEACIDLCVKDFTCLAYIFQRNDPTWTGCWMIDYMGANATMEADWRAAKWHDWAGCQSGYLPWSAREAEETSCYTGRGEAYVGTANKGYGSYWTQECADGEFCRNPTPETDQFPYCYEKRSGGKMTCKIHGCGQAAPKYVGNRGVAFELTNKNHEDHHNYHHAVPSRFYNPNQKWTHPIFYVSGSKDAMWYDQNVAGDYYMIQARNYFIAPYDGIYSFTVVADDRAELRMDFGDDGTYDFSTRVTYAISTDGTQDWSDRTNSKRYTLSKGEKFYIESFFTEYNGDARFQVSVIYHGLEGGSSWIDNRPKKEFNQDNYAYDIQRLYFDSDGREDQAWITLKVPREELEAGTHSSGITADEFVREAGLEFNIRQCGDNNQCFETGDINTKTWDSKAMEKKIKEEWLTTTCSHSGLFKPLHYHGTYETENTWPGRHHFVAGQHAMCGRFSHEVHNHDVWNTHVGQKFSTTDFQDLCFAYKGHIQWLQVYGTYKQVSDGNNWRNWMTVDVNLNSADWTFTCIKIADELDLVFGALRDENFLYFDVSNIRFSNEEYSPIYIDELHLGKMKSTLSITQTNQPLSFDGQVPVKCEVYYHASRWWGARIRFKWKTWNSESNCGYSAPLPELLPASTVDATGSTNLVDGANWFDDDYHNIGTPYSDHAKHHLLCDTCHEDTPKNYKRMSYMYKRSDNTKTWADVWIMKESIMNDEWDVDFKLTLEGRPGELSMNFNRDVHAFHLKNEMIATWPFLGDEQDGDLNIRISREGWCNDGYYFWIKTQQHGKMPKINMEFTKNSNNLRAEIFAKHDFTTGVITQYMPGSVTATAHHVPQVVVMANGQRSACDNCDFKWSADFTATVESVSASSNVIARGDSLDITFDVKSYDGTLDNVEFLLSDSPLNCDTSTITGDGSVKSITCTAADVPVSDNHSFVMVIPEVGTAEYTGATFSSIAGVGSYSPTVGSQHGGTVVTATGTGFKAGQVITVNIGGSDTECDSAGFEVTYDSLTCVTRSNSGIAAGSTPEVTSISKNSFTVMGGEEFTINGSGFDAESGCDSDGSVMIGDNEAEIVSWSSSEIVARSVATSDFGASDVVVYVCNKGNSNTMSASTPLRINNVNGAFSSLMGGREIVINGAGFQSDGGNEADDFSVNVGGIPCDVTSIEPNQIKCNTGAMGNTLRLKAAARGFSYKEGGADATDIEIEQGTEVEWSWMISLAGVTPQIQMQKVSNKGDASGTQMWSEPIIGNEGKFTKQFKNKGTYHYSTGLMDMATTFASGTIRVVDATDKAARVSVNINGVEAEHIGSSNNAQPAVADCSFEVATTAASNPEAGHYVHYSWGSTPNMASYKMLGSTASGYESDRFSPFAAVRVWMNGANGFDATACGADAQISFGEFQCVQDNANTGVYFQCDMEGTGLDVNESYDISVVIPGMGAAYYDGQMYVGADENGENGVYAWNGREVAFAAFGNTVTPDKISRFGGAELQIAGSGFVDPEVYFQVDGLGAKFPCAISAFDYTSIDCKMSKITSSANQADSTLVGTVVVGGESFTFDASFQTRDGKTPKVTSVSPMSVDSAGTTITLTGSNLDGLMVTIGGEECVTTSSAANSVECTMPDLATGYHSVKTHAMYGSVVMDNTQITSELAASSMSPSAGGLNGGVTVTVAGFGFNEDTVVSVRAEDGSLLCEMCYTTVVSPSELTFVAPRAVSANTAQVTVKHEFITTAIAPFTFTYSDISSALNAGSVTDNLSGGETIDLSGDFDCENVSIDFVQARDPCEAGAHQCHNRATCTPTADGLDYTCECDKDTVEEDGSAWYGHGNGRECYHFSRRDKQLYADAIGFCEAEGYYDFNIDSDAKLEWFKEYLQWIEGFNSRGPDFTDAYGTYVMINGVMSCVRNNNVNDVHEFEIVGSSAEECDNWGRDDDQFKKRVHCMLGQQGRRNCIDPANKGRNDYAGWINKSPAGLECDHWDNVGDKWNDYNAYSGKELMNRENYCSNPWGSSIGPFCPAKMRNSNGDIYWMECQIPSCDAMEQNTPRTTCAIKAFGFADMEGRNDDNWDPRYSSFHSDEGCYLANHYQGRMENPRRCTDRQRYGGYPFSIIPVDGTNFYQLMRNTIEDDPKYVMADPGADIPWQVRFERMSELGDLGFDVSRTYFNIEEDAFAPGTFAIRYGDYYIQAPHPHDCVQRSCGYLHMIHQDELSDYPAEDFAFIFQCRSDNFGDLIEQQKPQHKVIQTVTGTCSASSISITAPSLDAGNYKIIVRDGNGVAAGAVDVNYKMEITGATPAAVGVGGGTPVTFIGTGFSENTKAMLCGEELAFVEYNAAGQPGDDEEITFLTNPIDLTACPSPSLELSDFDESNDSDITEGGSRKRRNGLFNVDASLSPTITGVEPKMGGTAGGTKVTISGTKFGSNTADVEVTIHGSACTVDSVTDTEIVCETGVFPRDGTAQEPIDPVVTIANGPGIALSDGTEATQFWYIDRWSSPYTWGCSDDSCKPKDGEIIVIPAGQVILLDETTPHLAVLIIDGGKFIWAREDGIELHMDYGIVNSGGSFEIGTEEEPFCSGSALIKMYGHQRSINLPIYGAKVFAIRFGTIDIHGCPKTTTWTELDVTADVGATEIVLTHPVKDDWFVGNEIIIAATGDITNFHRSEKRVIAGVSDDGYTVTITEPLEHKHIAVCNNGPGNNGLGFGWAGEICMRAEVGLLTRNVKMMGNKNHVEDLAECDLGAGLSLGGTQTCFQNRYGHETGSDQFGSVLFLHKPDHAKIEFLEVTHAGQAFNLARYPIHFHQPGTLPTSYVRGCGIHNTFNRALTMHGVHNLTVEYNVIYNVMGLAFFLEDAVEEDNVLRYNLGIMNKKSSSLLNVDSTPSVFWIPNPNNIFYGNRAAGSTHFGFWFNPPDEPTGPSSKMPEYQNFCVKNRPLGLFYNNTAHSMGQYGMWVFTDLTPTVNGACDDRQPKAIKFGEIPEVHHGTGVAFTQDERDSLPGFFAWHCLRGAEVATGGAMHFVNFIAVNNWVAGLSWKETFLHTYALDAKEDEASMYKRSIVIGHIGGDDTLDACGDMGVETPWKFFAFTVDDIRFYNYDEPTPELAATDLSAYPTASELPERRCVAFDPCYGSNAFDCGAITYFKNVKWDNCARRTTFAWEHEAAIWDIDGTFAGQGPNKFIVSRSDAFDPAFCKNDNSGKYDLDGDAPHGAQICDGEKDGNEFKLHRFMFNKPSPESMKGTMAVFENEHGITKSGFRNCRPRGEGWMVLLQGNHEYSMKFEQHDHISNISYSGDIDDFETGQWLTIRHDFPERIDEANLNGQSSRFPMKYPGTQINETAGETWGDENTMEPFTFIVDKDTAPFSVKYVFNGKANTENPQLDEFSGAYTYGESYFVQPNFFKCFFKDCIVPEPEPPTPPPPLVKCNFLDCNGGMTNDWDDLTVDIAQHMVIDAAAVTAANNHFKFSSMFLEGTLEIEGSSIASGSELIIEADHMIINTGAESADNLNRRKRRDIQNVMNGALIIGTADNPIPCDVKVTVKISGDKFSQSFGAMPDSIPIGAKALGGLGSIQMHGCEISQTWSTLADTLDVSGNEITVNDDVSEWKVGDEIAVAATSFDHRETEYFSITAKNGQTLTLNATSQFRHLGSATTSKTLLGREYNQGAEVALLTRNIKLDGSGGAEGKVGARILITPYTEEINGHHYVRSGFGQFSFVEFKGFGQFGYDNYDDMRAQILFYQVDGAEDVDSGRERSYVTGCAFHAGFHTAVAAMYDSNNIEISNNVMFGLVGSAIKTDSIGLIIDGNVIGNVYQGQLYDDYFSSTVNANFADDLMPAGIDTEMTKEVTITNNRVAGVDGSCYAGNGEECDSEAEACSATTGTNAWTGNIGHSCGRGYYVFRVGHGCSKVSGFTFYKMNQLGVMFLVNKEVKNTIIENTIIADSKVAFSALMSGPDPYRHLAEEKHVTVKNSVIIGKDDNTYDCSYDYPLSQNFFAKGPTARQNPNLKNEESAAMLTPEFPGDVTGFPACAMFDLDVDVALYGKTCIFDTAFSEFNGKCGGKDFIVSGNKKGNADHTFKIDFVSGNSCTNCDQKKMVRFYRPSDDKVNPADCVDLHCDGKKKGIVQDMDGGMFGTAGTYLAESEFEWDGQTRGGVTYTSPRDGLGDYRIPSPMQTRLDGSKIPVEEVYTHAGVVRDPSCEYKTDMEDSNMWFCPASTGLEYHDIIYEMMDEDHINRRLTPLGVRENDGGYLDIINGPGDHSCCIGYACSLRLMTIHSTIACGKSYDYYFSSTLPLEAKFHFPFAPETCKIKIAFYTKRPNRVDIHMDGQFVPANNAIQNADGSIQWQKPDSSFVPAIDSHNSGANYQERENQLVHIILSGGHTYTVKTVQTLVLELAVTTELTEDEFYDNGNLAGNIAALLGIDPSRIRIMNVISESSARRRRRHVEDNWVVYGKLRRRREGGATENRLQLEIEPEIDSNVGAEALDEVAQEVIANPAALAEATESAMKEIDPSFTAEPNVAVAKAPKEPDTPPPPVTLAEQLGVAEMTPEDDLEEFIKGLSEAAGIDITTLETAQEKQAKEQEAADKASELITYDTPTTMVLDTSSIPTGPQLLGQKMFQAISLSMLNQDGEHMENVGFVEEPYQVRAEIFEPVLIEGGDTPSIDGDTVVEFQPGNGYAVFDNLIFRGGMTSCKIQFSVKRPSDSGIASVQSVAIDFLPEAPVGECIPTEGEGFDRKISMTETCDYVCLTPCVDLSGMGGENAGPICNDVTTCAGDPDAGNPTYATCEASGCACDLDSIPAVEDLNPADYMTAVCTSGAVELRMNKCVMNKFGFSLKDLYINGPTKTDDFSALASSVDNTCRGMLGFDNGPEYVFKIDRTLSDCKTETGTDADGKATYKNAVQGFSGTTNDVISRKKEVFIEFGCKFDVDLTVSTNIGKVGTHSYEVELEAGEGSFDVTMAVYEDNSFTKVADTDYEVAVPDHVNVGVSGNNLADTGYTVVAKNCWVTPDDDVNNPIKYDALIDGCPNPDDVDNVLVIENGVGNQARFSFASFQFVGQDPGQLIYGHCEVHICDPNAEACAPSCDGSRKRRNADDDTSSTVVSFGMNVAPTAGHCKRECLDGVCQDKCTRQDMIGK